MKVYMELPFTHVLCDADNWYSANLTDDYAVHFEETRRYTFRRHSLTQYKFTGLKPSAKDNCYVYTVLDPKTFVLS